MENFVDYILDFFFKPRSWYNLSVSVVSDKAQYAKKTHTRTHTHVLRRDNFRTWSCVVTGVAGAQRLEIVNTVTHGRDAPESQGRFFVENQLAKWFDC